MNIKDLKYIVCVAEYGHFGKAAQACFVSQPTLSGQIKKLEESLGVDLFERTNRQVTVTAAGHAIVKHARKVLEQEMIIRNLAKGFQKTMAGPFRLGVIPTLSPYLLPRIIQPLSEKFPEIDLILSENITETLLKQLQSHKLDAVLMATQIDSREYATIPLFKEPFLLASPSDRRQVFDKKITKNDLEGMQLLLLAEGHCLADQTMEICNQSRLQQGEMADLSASSLETLLQMVSAGFGSTLIPALAIDSPWLNSTKIMTSDIDLKNAHRQVSLVYRQSFPKLEMLKLFARLVKDNLPKTVMISS